MGDDYQWWQHAHAAMHEPLLLLTDLDTFYRPASTWVWVADRALLGDSPAGFHLTNLLLHGLAGVLLVFVGLRLGLPWAEAVFIGVLWTASPFSEEPAVSVAIRFQDLLFLSWLGLILLWPRNGRWSAGRVTGVALLTLLAAASKESWVVTPGLVVALEAANGRRRLTGWLRTATPFAAAAVVYTGIYFLVFPGGKHYYSSNLHVLAKLPHQLAAFLHLEQLAPLSFPLDWKGAFAIALVAGLAVDGWRRNRPAAVVGVGLLVLPMLPTLMVPFLPTRYTAIPYAGFLLLVASWVAAVRTERVHDPRGRKLAAGVGTSLAILVLIAGWLTVRADFEDYRRVSSAHGRLLEEARRVVDTVPLHRPFLVVRAERENPLAVVARSPRGLPKLFYVRHSDPYGLIDAAALFEWVLHQEDIRFERIEPDAIRGRPGDVLIHRDGGFVWASRDLPDLGKEASHWRASGLHLRIVRSAALGPAYVGVGVLTDGGNARKPREPGRL